MARNITYRPGWKMSVVCSNPAIPRSGGAVRLGILTGIALTDRRPDGTTSVDFGPFIARLPVRDELNLVGGIPAGAAVFYRDDAAFLTNDPAGTNHYFGIALAPVGRALTATIEVLHSVSPGAGTLAVDSITTTRIAPGAVTESRIAPASLTGTVAAVVANANVIGGLLVLHRIDCPDVAQNNDIILTHRTRLIDAWGLNIGAAAHATVDTWQVFSGPNAVSDIVTKTAVVNAVRRISTINPVHHEIPVGGILRIAVAKGVGTLNAAVTVYVLGVRVA
ncbi:MAG: hypothetical protein DDT23_00007 [candidate division WS2 bacterium]|nr:hypothetical protein [Candidatus Lithacetigena glycinireducens]